MSNKQIRYCFVSLLFVNVYASEKHYDHIKSAVVALIIGKLSYDYFYHYITPEQTIEHCQSTFTAIQQDIHYYRKLYRNDAQMSNWELKEIIVDISKNPYPFLEYYTSLQKTLLLLQKHSLNITQQLYAIKKYEKKLHYKNIVLQLETEGKVLKNHISKLISLVTILKLKILSFKEYHEDCYYSQEKMGNP
jgi:hypothetical protein